MAQSNAELKNKLRKLKKLECKLRFGSVEIVGRAPNLVFDAFFDLREGGAKRARYSLNELSKMERQEFLTVIEAYMAEVYFRVYGFREDEVFVSLNEMGLPFNADENAIKKRFRELAKKYHPDTGGDQERFVKLRDQYNELMNKVKPE